MVVEVVCRWGMVGVNPRWVTVVILPTAVAAVTPASVGLDIGISAIVASDE
jgi:hypothetical protein